MADRPSIWWTYDPDNQSFGALPPGPLLLPAVFIAAFVGIAGAIRDSLNQPERVLPRELVNSNDYQRKKQRYYELIDKKVYGEGLTLGEHTELEQLKRPWWIESGTWSY
jgi:hypothetical protein